MLKITTKITRPQLIWSMGASKKNKSKRSKVIVGFEDEMVKREDARVILKHISDHKVTENSENTTSENAKYHPSGMDTVKQKRKRKKGIGNDMETCITTVDDVERDGLEQKTSKTMKKKRHVQSNTMANGDEDVPLKKKKNVEKSPPREDNDADVNEPVLDKKESIRAQKRRKHAELLSQKKVKAELTMQQNALNYLSKWKYSRSDWKFEKLKQIWLHQNLYDVAKIPKEFWDVTVEYFAGSKGATRDTILKDAVKIINGAEQSEVNNEDEDYQMKLQRARDIIQYLQE